jgi:DNA-binding MarR family transcriptional regulator
MPDTPLPLYFRLFNEVGIIDQLASSQFEERMPQGFLVSHFSVLNHLIRVADGRTPLQLARAFQVAKTTMTHTLSGLEKRGLIQMRPNPDDKRSKCVFVTASGRAFRDHAVRNMSPDLQELQNVLSQSEIEDMVEKLERLRVYMGERRGKLAAENKAKSKVK